VALLQSSAVVSVGRNCDNRPNRDVDFVLLSRIANRLSAAAPMHEILEDVVKFVTSAVMCDSCMVYLLEKDELVLRASRNPHPEVVNRLRLQLGEGITGWVAVNREPVVVTERAYEDRRFKLFNELPEDRFEAFMSVPVVSGGKLVGVVNVQNRKQHQYSEREIVLLATLGVLVGAEIERVRLEHENSQLIQKLETRTLIERAKGILQSDLKISEDTAYRIMQRESQQRRRSMKEIAEAVILIDELKRDPVSISEVSKNRKAAAGAS
jgi:uroporphyrinogen-III synthase